jgi:glutaredoxin
MEEMKFKGRISIFSITGCKYCKMTKEKMNELGLPFVEINLDIHPQYRKQMYETTNQSTVPQIFFNSVN